MGKGDMMEYLTRSVYRYLEKEEKLMSFERMMILFLKKLPFAMGEKERMQSFLKLKEEIEKLERLQLLEKISNQFGAKNYFS